MRTAHAATAGPRPPIGCSPPRTHAPSHRIDSTPSFLLGRTGTRDHRVLAGAQDYATLRKELDAMIAR
jgi:hypothetical protein